MAQNTNPIFGLTAHVSLAELSVANTNRDGTGTIVDVFDPTTFGSRPRAIKIIAKSTTTAGLINLFIYNGTAWKFWTQVVVAAKVPSATVTAFEAYVDPDELELLDLQDAYKIGAAPTQNETFNVFAYGIDLS